jgi:hypothetical protein
MPKHQPLETKRQAIIIMLREICQSWDHAKTATLETKRQAIIIRLREICQSWDQGCEKFVKAGIMPKQQPLEAKRQAIIIRLREICQSWDHAKTATTGNEKAEENKARRLMKCTTRR